MSSPNDRSDLVIELRDVVHRYDGVLAVDGISLSVEAGSFTAIIGPNGAGKSTLAQIIGGVITPTGGEIRLFGGAPKIRKGRTFLDAGICLVPEGRRLFGQLSVYENLSLGGYGARLDRVERAERLEKASAVLPQAIRDSMKTRYAGNLSGGERQMVALARALMAKPTVLVVDEPSLGLAPIMVDLFYETLQVLNRDGVTVLVIEQLAGHAIEFASSMILLDHGKTAYQGPTTGEGVEAALLAGYVGHA
ncbi:MAG: ABC transporter ATP-binding protein [Flavobacteriaceae bacterium]